MSTMTKQNNEKKSNARRKLIPAIGMLTVSAMMLSSATYAWFTMNKEVQVTGMEVKTKVGSNLLICSTNLEADYKSDTLRQSRQALLEPVSTINGVDDTFFYTVDAAADGKKIHGTTDPDASTINPTSPEVPLMLMHLLARHNMMQTLTASIQLCRVVQILLVPATLMVLLHTVTLITHFI